MLQALHPSFQEPAPQTECTVFLSGYQLSISNSRLQIIPPVPALQKKSWALQCLHWRGGGGGGAGGSGGAQPALAAEAQEERGGGTTTGFPPGAPGTTAAACSTSLVMSSCTADNQPCPTPGRSQGRFKAGPSQVPPCSHDNLQ